MAAAPAKSAKSAKTSVANGEEAVPVKKSKKLLWIILAVFLLAGGGGGAAAWFLMPKQAAVEKPKPLPPAQYIALDPAFIVNLADAGTTRFLQADIQLQIRDADTIAAVALHMPIIRNRLLLLFGQQTSQDLNGRNGKEQLQTQALNEVKSVLKAQQAADKVEALLFTSIVIQ